MYSTSTDKIKCIHKLVIINNLWHTGAVRTEVYYIKKKYIYINSSQCVDKKDNNIGNSCFYKFNDTLLVRFEGDNIM